MTVDAVMVVTMTTTTTNVLKANTLQRVRGFNDHRLLFDALKLLFVAGKGRQTEEQKSYARLLRQRQI